jgi:hypothetical protein
MLAALALLLYGLKRLRVEEHRLARALMAAALAGGVVVYVHSAFDFNLRIPSNSLQAALLGSLATAFTWPRREPAAARGTDVGSWVSHSLLVSCLVIATLTAWRQPRWDTSTLARVTRSPRSDLRRSSLESDVAALLSRRPGQASAWVQLAWLRMAMAPEEARALAGWGVFLDPRHEELALAAAPLRKAAR